MNLKEYVKYAENKAVIDMLDGRMRKIVQLQEECKLIRKELGDRCNK